MLALVLSAAEDDGFVPPGTKDFDLPPIIEGVEWFTKPVLLVMVAIGSKFRESFEIRRCTKKKMTTTT